MTPDGLPLADIVAVAALGLATVELDDSDDVLDPAGHEGDVYAACVDERWGLCKTLVSVL